MAFPFVKFSNFEIGDDTEWNGGETDTNAKLTVRHYSDLARYGLTPYRGSYALHVDLSGGTADAYLAENTDFDDLTANVVRFIRFYFRADDLVMAASDRFTIFALRATAEEVVVDVRNNAGVIQILAAETGAAATVRAHELVQGVWHSVELRVDLDAGAGNDGTIDFYLDGRQVSTQITALDQEAITSGRIGAMSIDAGTTAGHLLFDDFVYDDTDRVFPDRERFPTQLTLVKSGQVFIGPGSVDSATLLTTGATNVLRLWDTDQANTDGAQTFSVDLDIATHTTVGGPIWFQRGCYAQLSGTNPRGQVVVVKDVEEEGMHGPVYYSDWGYRHYAQNRKVRAYGT